MPFLILSLTILVVEDENEFLYLIRFSNLPKSKVIQARKAMRLFQVSRNIPAVEINCNLTYNYRILTEHHYTGESEFNQKMPIIAQTAGKNHMKRCALNSRLQ